MMVQVPPGVAAGQDFVIHTPDGQQMQVKAVVPSGQMMQVHVPATPPVAVAVPVMGVPQPAMDAAAAQRHLNELVNMGFDHALARRAVEATVRRSPRRVAVRELRRALSTKEHRKGRGP